MTTPTDLLDLVTLQNLVELDDGKHGLLSEMIGIFKEDTPHRIQDILDAADRGDALEFSRAAHALKGGSGALGAKALRALASELETQGRGGSVDPRPDLRSRLETTFSASVIALEAYALGLQNP